MHAKRKVQEDVRRLGDDQLIVRLKSFRTEELRVVLKIVRYLREVDRRELHLKRGCDTLKQFAMNHLKYSEGEAKRRVDAMLLVKALPGAEKELGSGNLSMTVASEVLRFANRKNLDIKELVPKVLGKSSRKAGRILLGICPEAIKPETLRQVTATHTELRVTMDEELMAQLEELKSVYSHRNPSMTYLGLFKILAKDALKKSKPKSVPEIRDTKASSVPEIPNIKANLVPKIPNTKGDSEVQPSAPTAKRVESKGAKNAGGDHKQEARRTFLSDSKSKKSIRTFKTYSKSRVATPAMRRYIIDRDKTWTYTHNGKRCGSKAFLEVDHIVSYASGGKTELENLTLLCRAHNQHKSLSRCREGSASESHQFID
jgi:hypothetical protein